MKIPYEGVGIMYLCLTEDAAYKERDRLMDKYGYSPEVLRVCTYEVEDE